MRKREIRIIFALVLSLVLVCGVTFSYATSLSDVNKKIDNTQDQLNEGKNKVEDLNKDITSLQKQIDSAQTSISSLETKIAAKEQKLAAKKAKLNENTDAMNKRLRNMYKSGSMSFVDIILSSGNVSELIENMEMIKLVYRSDKDLVSSLKKSYNKTKKESKELSAMKTRLVSKQNQLSSDKSAISKKRSAVAANNQELSAKIDALNSEADRITQELQSSSSSSSSSTYSGGALLWPCPSSHTITSYFGYRMHPILHVRKLHTGIDIGASYGAKIVAANDGKVIASYYNSSYGNMVMIDHGGGIVTLYAHASKRLVSKGTTVSRGQTIARVGSTGSSTGNHLHFEVRVNGVYKNPLKYL